MFVLRMIRYLIEEGDNPAIYALSELPGSQWEVHARPQDLCILHVFLRCTAHLLG